MGHLLYLVSQSKIELISLKGTYRDDIIIPKGSQMSSLGGEDKISPIHFKYKLQLYTKYVSSYMVYLWNITGRGKMF